MYFFSVQTKKRLRTIFSFLASIILVNLLAVSMAAAENLVKQDSTPSKSSDVVNGNDKDSVSIQALNKAAFGTMAQTMLPMSPEQIKRLRELFNQTQAAAATTPGTHL